MRKDIKIGMLIGLGLVIIGLIVISSWPGGTVEERLKDSSNEPDPIVKPPVDRVTKPPVERVEYVVEPAEDAIAKAAKEADEQVDLPREPDERLTRVAEHVVKEFREPVVEASPRIHIVAENEVLSSIAELHYGDSNKWHLIAEANKNVITNVDRISPGMRLVIPKPK